MIECPACGKQHRTEKALEACVKRHAKRKEREDRLAADTARREANAARVPPRDFLREKMMVNNIYKDETPMLSTLVSKLNKDYPPPEGKYKWELIDVVKLWVSKLNWPF